MVKRVCFYLIFFLFANAVRKAAPAIAPALATTPVFGFSSSSLLSEGVLSPDEVLSDVLSSEAVLSVEPLDSVGFEVSDVSDVLEFPESPELSDVSELVSSGVDTSEVPSAGLDGTEK